MDETGVLIESPTIARKVEAWMDMKQIDQERFGNRMSQSLPICLLTLHNNYLTTEGGKSSFHSYSTGSQITASIISRTREPQYQFSGGPIWYK